MNALRAKCYEMNMKRTCKCCWGSLFPRSMRFNVVCLLLKAWGSCDRRHPRKSTAITWEQGEISLDPNGQAPAMSPGPSTQNLTKIITSIILSTPGTIQSVSCSVVQYNEYYQLMTLNLEMEYLKEKFELWKRK